MPKHGPPGDPHGRGLEYLRGLGEGVGDARYGAGNDPYLQALTSAETLGYPIPGSSTDVGEAQRYHATQNAARRFGPIVPAATNVLHELLLAPFAEGEGGFNLKRLKAGMRGIFGRPKPEKGKF